jgi:hypothetical protein
VTAAPVDDYDEWAAAQVKGPQFVVGGGADVDKADGRVVEPPAFFDDEDEWDQVVPPREPELIQVEGGEAVVYDGESHLLFGHGGDGKTFLALSWCTEVLSSGGVALLIDYESNRETTKARLKALGVTAQQAKRFAYWRISAPLGGPGGKPWAKALAEFLDEYHPSLSVLDSTTRSMSAAGLNESDNSDAGKWWSQAVVPFEQRRCTVVVIAHLGHENEHNKDRLAPRGASAFMQAMTGAGYRIDAPEPFSREVCGRLKGTCAKDREGSRRKGEVAFDATVQVRDGGAHIRFVMTAPAEPIPKGKSDPEWEPTEAMDKIVEHLQDLHPERLSMSGLQSALPFKESTTAQAVKMLLKHGRVDEVAGPRRARLIGWVAGASTNDDEKPF